MSLLQKLGLDKKGEVVFFSSTAIALYGYDQGMMSLINTNYDYLSTLGISGDDPLVGIIVSVYYLGCAVGAVLASLLADKIGRKPSILACIGVTVLGNLLMFVTGLGGLKGPMTIMFIGRVVMGLGVGGFDSVIPVYSSELNEEGGRGVALAKEFQSNIFGLNMAFAINLAVTHTLGKENQWAWRIPIIAMQIYPVILFSLINSLPESPRWFIFHDRQDDAKTALTEIYGEDESDSKHKDLVKSHEEESSSSVGYSDMLIPGRAQWHPTVITIMGQVNQALTGYGAVSVYGPQIFELLGLGVSMAEYLTQANYVSYFFLMTFAWLLIDRVGRRILMVVGAFGISVSFVIMTIVGGLAANADKLGIPQLPFTIIGGIFLFIATGLFGVCWLTQPWLIPTEIYPVTARAQGAAVSVIIWGLANFAVTLLSPIGFNNLQYWLLLIFAVTNLFAGWWTWTYLPETGERPFEENQRFFVDAKEQGTWTVRRINKGEFLGIPGGEKDGENGESRPLLGGNSS